MSVPEPQVLPRSLLDYLPPYEADDPMVQNLLNAVALELARIEQRATDVIWKFFPQNADDTYGTLGMWEMLLGLPVMPADLTLTERRDLVVSSVRARDAGTGIAWRELMTQAIGTSFDVQVGPAPYTITIRTSMGYTGASTLYVRTIARRISPAHLQIESGFKEHFVVGISKIGDAL